MDTNIKDELHLLSAHPFLLPTLFYIGILLERRKGTVKYKTCVFTITFLQLSLVYLHTSKQRSDLSYSETVMPICLKKTQPQVWQLNNPCLAIKQSLLLLFLFPSFCCASLLFQRQSSCSSAYNKHSFWGPIFESLCIRLQGGSSVGSLCADRK